MEENASRPLVSLTKQEIETLVNVLEQVAPSKLSDARILIRISDTLKVMRDQTE